MTTILEGIRSSLQGYFIALHDTLPCKAQGRLYSAHGRLFAQLGISTTEELLSLLSKEGDNENLDEEWLNTADHLSECYRECYPIFLWPRAETLSNLDSKFAVLLRRLISAEASGSDGDLLEILSDVCAMIDPEHEKLSQALRFAACTAAIKAEIDASPFSKLL